MNEVNTNYYCSFSTLSQTSLYTLSHPSRISSPDTLRTAGCLRLFVCCSGKRVCISITSPEVSICLLYFFLTEFLQTSLFLPDLGREILLRCHLSALYRCLRLLFQICGFHWQIIRMLIIVKKGFYVSSIPGLKIFALKFELNTLLPVFPRISILVFTI